MKSDTSTAMPPGKASHPDSLDRSTRRSAALALLLLVPAPSIGASFSLILLPGPIGSAIYLLAKLWMFALPAVWWLWVDRQRPSWSPPRKGGFAVGAALGIAISVIIFAAYYTVGVRLIDVEQVRQVAAANELTSVGRYLGLCAYLIFVNSVLEEYVYRWFVFRKFERFLPAGAAVLAAAAAFTVHHVIALVPQMGWTVAILANIGVFVGGAIWSWLYLRYQSVWPGYLSHAIVDLAIFIIGWQLLFG